MDVKELRDQDESQLNDQLITLLKRMSFEQKDGTKKRIATI
jgi:hypothetical protein